MGLIILKIYLKQIWYYGLRLPFHSWKAGCPTLNAPSLLYTFRDAVHMSNDRKVPIIEEAHNIMAPRKPPPPTGSWQQPYRVMRCKKGIINFEKTFSHLVATYVALGY